MTLDVRMNVMPMNVIMAAGMLVIVEFVVVMMVGVTVVMLMHIRVVMMVDFAPVMRARMNRAVERRLRPGLEIENFDFGLIAAATGSAHQAASSSSISRIFSSSPANRSTAREPQAQA